MGTSTDGQYGSAEEQMEGSIFKKNIFMKIKNCKKEMWNYFIFQSVISWQSFDNEFQSHHKTNEWHKQNTNDTPYVLNKSVVIFCVDWLIEVDIWRRFLSGKLIIYTIL